MHQSAYNQAVEIAKIILQHDPGKLLPGSKPAADYARNVSTFIEKLAEKLTELEQRHD
jgi:hypothetical protein